MADTMPHNHESTPHSAAIARVLDESAGGPGDDDANRPASRGALAGLLVREIRYARRLRLHVHYAREQRKALRAALAEAVTMIGTVSRQLDRARQNSADRAEHNRVLLAEIATLTAEIARLRPQGPRARHVTVPKGSTTYNETVQ